MPQPLQGQDQNRSQERPWLSTSPAPHPSPCPVLPPDSASSCTVAKITWHHSQGPEPQGTWGGGWAPPLSRGQAGAPGWGEIRESRGGPCLAPSDAAESLGPGAEEGALHPRGLPAPECWAPSELWAAGAHPGQARAPPASHGRESVPGLRPEGTAWPAPQAQHRGGHRVGSANDLQGTQAVHTGWLRPGLEPASLRGHPRGRPQLSGCRGPLIGRGPAPYLPPARCSGGGSGGVSGASGASWDPPGPPQRPAFGLCCPRRGQAELPQRLAQVSQAAGGPGTRACEPQREERANAQGAER